MTGSCASSSRVRHYGSRASKTEVDEDFIKDMETSIIWFKRVQLSPQGQYHI
ncbi:hypothetical protein HETIRDRAFT_422623 [Heterobasidion irregulare TC 32-1]|uniref:Uncharacterized protein n=1 Tax=Heterobasidion irregulare (strain TC 32-1) TaxID=747525 RepID=W4JRX1_HETIT|nr:uncharacterized protein HETIRDRAFT_422623 [Heterobasidion irregulare TC 32-1]ETW76278.1 hypothetical protein HETIRDRAFT_422623 [Heterobasidion irregulare TC 32-1]